MSHQIQARVESITPLTDSILQLILAPKKYIDYQAGQYLQILSGKEFLSYSIANAPLGSHTYELHIRHAADNPYTQVLLADIKQKGAVTLRLPFGDCDVPHLYPNQPIMFIAGGTGFAPIKAMMEQLLANGDARTFELYWGARSQSDLYMDHMVSHWQTHVSHFQYFSQLSTPTQSSFLSKILARHAGHLHEWQFVIGGPFDMVYDTRDQLVAEGALPTHLFSDAFSFEEKK